jgi:hypothetical protein
MSGLAASGVGEIYTTKVKAKGNVDIFKQVDEPSHRLTRGRFIVVKQN